MYCEPCGRERPQHSRFCVLCGNRLVVRSAEAIEVELTHVRWLLTQLPGWDTTLAPAQVRNVLRAHFVAQEQLLADALVPPPVLAPALELAPPVQVERAVVEPPRIEAPAAPSAPTPSLAPTSPAAAPPSAPPPAPPRGPSAWERLWKPVLGESVGWFIGAFLILAGTFSFVSDAWETMSGTNRSLTVFGLSVFWTVGFAGWAKMLERREVTRPASVVLWRIAAAVAPLATVALGPLVGTMALVWPLMIIQALVAGALSHKVVFDAWGRLHAARASVEAWVLAVAMAGATVVLGAGPALPSLLAPWLELAPVLLAAFSWRRGAVSTTGTLERFSVVTMGYALLLVAVRLHVTAVDADVGAPWGVHAVAVSAFAAAALELRRRGPVVADAWSVVTVALQGVALVPAAFCAAPAFVVAALLATLTTARLALREDDDAPTSQRAARWLVAAYAFGYAAFQRLDTVVPPIVKVWFAALKRSLGYESAPLPASYVSVYAALFVLTIGLFAGWRLSRATNDGRRARADVLLRCTAWGALVFGAMALWSLPTDARPAVLALPALMLTTLVLGQWHGRVDLTRAGALLAGATGVAFAQAWGEAWPVAGLALALALAAALAVRAVKAQQEALSAAAMLLVALTLGLSFIGPPQLEQAVALVLASAAALLVARTLEDRTLLTVACTVPLLLEVRFGAPWMLAVTALALAALLPDQRRSGSRLAVLWPVSVVAAVAAAGWEAVRFGDWPTLSLALGAAALVLGARRARTVAGERWARAAEGLGLLFVLAALCPLSEHWPQYLPWHAQLLAAAVALGASVHAVRFSRTWQGVTLAGGVVALALACAPWHAHGAWLAALVSMLATGALLASVTVPLAALTLVMTASDEATWLVALAGALSVVALFEEFEFTWKKLLNQGRVAWGASLTAALLTAVAAQVTQGQHVPLVCLASAVLPLLWARATRQPAALAVGLAINAWVGLAAPGSFGFATPALALAYARGALGFDVVTRLLGTQRMVTRNPLVLVSLGAALLAVRASPQPWLASAWVVALLLLGGELLPVNVVGATVVALLSPPLQLPAAALLVLVSAALHHARARTHTLLGVLRSELASVAASAGAVVLAFASAVRTASLEAHLALAGTLVAAGVLSGAWPLVSLAALAAALDLQATVRQGWPALTTLALPAGVLFAAMAAAVRLERPSQHLDALWRRLGVDPQAPASTPWWWGAAAVSLVGLVEPTVGWLVLPALLVLTPSQTQAVVAIALGALTVGLVTPHEVAGLSLTALGAALAWLGVWQNERQLVARAWFHAGWALSLAGLVVVGFNLSHVAVPASWALGAVTAWAITRRVLALEWVGWLATWLAAHVLVGHAGLVLATGAPTALVLPWFGLTTGALALLALGFNGGQRRGVGLVLGWAATAQLVAALSLIEVSHPREALVALVAGGLVLAGAVVRAARNDDGRAAWLGQGVLVVSVLALRRLGAGASPGVFEAWAAMISGPLLWGLSRLLAREQRPLVSKALRNGAVTWPLLGLLAAPWAEPGALILLLLVHAAHFAVLARTGLQRTGSALAALAFNGAMIAAFFATGWQGPQDLALPLGLSVMALTYTFRDDLGRDVQVRLRALAMAAVYGAAAWRPLTFSSVWGLGFCVVVCVLGVAAGAALRIRSYVLLGTAFLVTSVVATLIRQGLAEPRLGAVLLALLGLSVVGFMVLFTTRRAELLARVGALQKLLGSWER
jgi:hypothetical protein